MTETIRCGTTISKEPTMNKQKSTMPAFISWLLVALAFIAFAILHGEAEYYEDSTIGWEEVER